MNLQISEERFSYLKQKKRRKFLIAFTQIFLLLFFIFIWEWLANIGILDSFITSQPSRILKTLLNYK